MWVLQVAWLMCSSLFYLLVRQPAGHEPQDLGLPWCQACHVPARGLGRKPAFHEGGHCRRGQQRLARRDRADRIDECIRGGVLQQETGGTRPQRSEDILVQAEHRQHQHPGFGQARVTGDGAGRSDPVQLRHADVHQHDIRCQLAGDRHGLDTGGSLRDDPDAGLVV